MPTGWTIVDDLVNPYGDDRGQAVSSVWMFHLTQNILIHLKNDCVQSAPLASSLNKAMGLDDLKPCTPASPPDETLAGPYWKPDLNPSLREKAFIRPLVRDFGYTWRHILRSPMKQSTFIKLAYGITSLLTMKFDVAERAKFEYVANENELYVEITALPEWDAPCLPVMELGTGWCVLAQNLEKGVRMTQLHLRNNARTGSARDVQILYVILVPRYIVLCKSQGNELAWTRPAPLCSNDGLTDAAVGALVWAASVTARPATTLLHRLPPEIQDRILFYAGVSFVASAKLGCELGLGLPLTWLDTGVKISLSDTKESRTDKSPIESQILFQGKKSGLSYKRERRYPQDQIIKSAEHMVDIQRSTFCSCRISTLTKLIF